MRNPLETKTNLEKTEETPAKLWTNKQLTDPIKHWRSPIMDEIKQEVVWLKAEIGAALT